MPKQVFIDEVAELASSRLERSDSSQIHFINRICELARERAIQLDFFSQYSTGIATSVLENFAVKGIVGALGDDSSYRKFGETIGLSREQHDDARKHKKPGLLTVSSPEVPPCRVAIPDISFIKRRAITPEEIRASADRLLEMAKDDIVLIEDEPSPSEATPPRDECLEVLLAFAEREINSFEKKSAMPLIDGLSTVLEALGIKSAHKRRVVKKLEERGLLIQRRLRRGKSTISAAEITKAGWALLKMQAPKWPGKCGWFSAILTHCVKERLEEQGYHVETEARRECSPGKYAQPDLFAVRGADSVAIETIVTDPQHAGILAEKNLKAGISRIIFTTPTSKILDLVRRALKKTPGDIDPAQIELKTIGEILK